MIVLDTDHLSLLMQGTGPEGRRIMARLEAIDPANLATTIITFEEQTRGWLAFTKRARSASQMVEGYGRLKKHLDTYQRMNVLDFDQEAAMIFLSLRRSKIRVGTMDLKIGAIALAREATLLSRNIVDFGRIFGLKVEDWSA